MSRVQSASHVGLYACVITSVEQRASRSSKLRPLCQKDAQHTHTINLCRICNDERRVSQGDAQVFGANWRALIKQKASRGMSWTAFGVEQFLRRMWGRFTIHGAWVRSVLEDAENVKRLGTDGRWDPHTAQILARGYFTLAKDCIRLDIAVPCTVCDGTLLVSATTTLRSVRFVLKQRERKLRVSARRVVGTVGRKNQNRGLLRVWRVLRSIREHPRTRAATFSRQGHRGIGVPLYATWSRITVVGKAH